MINHASFWGGVAAPYEIEQSLRFDGTSGKLTRTNPSSSGITNAYKWSYSFWLKHSDVSSAATITQPLLSGGNTPGAGRTYCGWGYVDPGRFWIGGYNGSAYIPDIRPTDRVWRDPSAWEHFMLVYDTSESTNTDRIKIYSNGVRWEPTGGVGGTIGSTQLFYAVNYESRASNIGYDNIQNSYFDGYMAEVHFVDGQALDQYDFGEFDSNGVWRPIEYTGTYGSNGHYLKFDPSATNGVGHDHSGNGNNFTASGFTTSGTGTDVMNDTPTTNYATLNPLWARNTYGLSTLSNGNLEFSDSGISTSWGGRGSTFEISSGKWYMEWKCTDSSGQNLVLAVLNTGHYGLEHFMVQNPQTKTGCWGPQENGSSRWIILNGTQNTSGDPYYDTLNGQVVGIAIDADAGTATWYRNGTAISDLTDIDISVSDNDAWVVMGITSNGSGTSFVANFGQRAFEQTPPTGYSAWNTSSLPAPDIADGSDYFNTVLYTGTGSSSQSITGVGFAPDFVWLKNRTDARWHRVADKVRGQTKVLYPNETDVEATQAFSSLDSDGFTVLADTGNDGWNESGDAHVAWNWLAGNGTSSNTNGDITSTVSVNATAGFSIVSWTVGSTDNQTVGHGLGVPPDLIITKNRDTAYGWATYHSSLGATKYLELDTTASEFTNSIAWNDTEPTSTVFTIGDASWFGSSTDGMIAYCFAEVEGFSKFGSYTGNSSDDGPFVYCGFKPAWIMAKASTNSLTQWIMYDTARSTYNVADEYLQPSNNAAEQTGNNVEFDILSNGFKLRGSDQQVNTSHTYIYAAFAEHPFGGSGVSPATAR